MEDFNYIKQCNDAFKNNLSKIIIALGIMFIGSQFITSLMLGFSIVVLSSGALISIVYSFFIMFLVMAILFAFQYGLSVLLYLFGQNKNAVLGHLFLGFKSFGKMLIACLPYTIIIICSTFASIYFWGGIEKFDAVLQAAASEDPTQINADAFLQMSNAFMFITMTAMAISVIVYLPFAFFNFELYENGSKKSVFACLIDSIKLLAKNAKFTFVICIKTIYKELILFVVLFSVGNFIPLGIISNNFLGSLLSTIISIAGLVSTILMYIVYVKWILISSICFNYKNGNIIEYELIDENIDRLE